MDRPASPDVQSPPDDGPDPAARERRSGEGAHSALARLRNQEEARARARPADDAPSRA